SSRATAGIASSGTQSRTSPPSGSTPIPFSRSLPATAEPTRPEPMTLMLSNTPGAPVPERIPGTKRVHRRAATLASLVGRRLLLVLAAAAALLAAAGQARAAIVLTPCKTGGVECGTVTVPLDRTGATPGTIGLHVEVLPASGTSRGTMFLIAGGPGQGSAGSFDLTPGFNRDLMQYMFPGYTLVA